MTTNRVRVYRCGLGHTVPKSICAYSHRERGLFGYCRYCQHRVRVELKVEIRRK